MGGDIHQVVIHQLLKVISLGKRQAVFLLSGGKVGLKTVRYFKYKIWSLGRV